MQDEISATRSNKQKITNYIKVQECKKVHVYRNKK